MNWRWRFKKTATSSWTDENNSSRTSIVCTWSFETDVTCSFNLLSESRKPLIGSFTHHFDSRLQMLYSNDDDNDGRLGDHDKLTVSCLDCFFIPSMSCLTSLCKVILETLEGLHVCSTRCNFDSLWLSKSQDCLQNETDLFEILQQLKKSLLKGLELRLTRRWEYLLWHWHISHSCSVRISFEETCVCYLYSLFTLPEILSRSCVESPFADSTVLANDDTEETSNFMKVLAIDMRSEVTIDL